MDKSTINRLEELYVHQIKVATKALEAAKRDYERVVGLWKDEMLEHNKTKHELRVLQGKLDDKA